MRERKSKKTEEQPGLFDQPAEDTTVKEDGRGDLKRFDKRPCGWCGRTHAGLQCPA